jgi:hypothetical protein
LNYFWDVNWKLGFLSNLINPQQFFIFFPTPKIMGEEQANLLLKQGKAEQQRTASLTQWTPCQRPKH